MTMDNFKKIIKVSIVAIISWQARIILQKHNPKIVAVTGSVGKTSAKDAVATVLGDCFSVRKSQKSFNSEFGVPLTIIGRESGWTSAWLWFKNIMYGFRIILFPYTYPEWLILEVGADTPGDIKKITSWLKPNVSLITRLASIPVHVEFFDSPQAVWKEKSYLARAVRPGGYLILNADDPRGLEFKDLTQEKIMTYGLSPADVYGSHITITYSETKSRFPTGFSCRINNGGNSVPLSVKGALGVQHVYPLLSAVAVGLSQGVNILRAVHSLESHETPSGRMKLISGVKDTLIIDDTYNSSPVALKEALTTLGEIECSGKKIAILGDMLELGGYSIEEHKKAGALAASVVDYLIVVGVRSRFIVEGALAADMAEKNIFKFDDAQKAGKFVETRIKSGDIILVKGSQGIRLEKAVLELMSEPKKASELLVRQDIEWEKR